MTAPAATSADTDPTEVTALQATLAQEHAAVWVLALVGARTSASTQAGAYAAVQAAYAWHVATRDELGSRVAALGATPVAAAAAYAATGGLDTPDGRLAAALAVERACAGSYVALVAATTGDQRRWATGLLTATAVRELAVGGRPETLPGYPAGAASSTTSSAASSTASGSSESPSPGPSTDGR